jgi:hypothetical protein
MIVYFNLMEYCSPASPIPSAAFPTHGEGMKLASCSGQGKTQVCTVRKTCLRNQIHGQGDRPEMKARPFGRWGCRYYLSADSAEDRAWFVAG